MENKKLTSEEFWEQVELNEDMGMAEHASVMAACEFFGIEYGEWPDD